MRIMNVSTVIMTTLTLTVLALAGCADDPVTGDFASSTVAFNTEGTITYDIMPASNSYPAGDEQACRADGVTDPINGLPEPVGGSAPSCEDAFSSVSVLVQLPAPGGSDYTVVLVNETSEKSLGALTEGDMGWALDAEFPGEDLSTFSHAQIRYGEVVLASAHGVSNGAITFARDESLKGFSVVGSFTGKDLTLEIDGLPEGGTYSGYLYEENEDGSITSTANFNVRNGTIEYQAPQALDNYVQFHIHFTGSKINLIQADI